MWHKNVSIREQETTVTNLQNERLIYHSHRMIYLHDQTKLCICCGGNSHSAAQSNDQDDDKYSDNDHDGNQQTEFSPSCFWLHYTIHHQRQLDLQPIQANKQLVLLHFHVNIGPRSALLQRPLALYGIDALQNCYTERLDSRHPVSYLFVHDWKSLLWTRELHSLSECDVKCCILPLRAVWQAQGVHSLIKTARCSVRCLWKTASVSAKVMSSGRLFQ